MQYICIIEIDGNSLWFNFFGNKHNLYGNIVYKIEYQISLIWQSSHHNQTSYYDYINIVKDRQEVHTP